MKVRNLKNAVEAFVLCLLPLALAFSLLTPQASLAENTNLTRAGFQPKPGYRYSNPIHRSVIYLDAQNFQSVVMDTNRPVLILFTNALTLANNNEQGWYEELAFQLNSQAVFAIVDVNMHPRFAQDLGWSVTPTMYFIPANKQAKIYQGYLSKSQMIQYVLTFLRTGNYL